MFYGYNYLCVTKLDEEDWDYLKPDIYSAITEHYAKGVKLLTDKPPPEDTVINDDDSDEVVMIKEIIMARVRPFVQTDGGDVAFKQFDEQTGVLILLMKGS